MLQISIAGKFFKKFFYKFMQIFGIIKKNFSVRKSYFIEILQAENEQFENAQNPKSQKFKLSENSCKFEKNFKN